MLVIFLAIDMLWLGVLSKNLYKEQMGSLMAKKPKWSAAILFYAIYIFGLYILVIHPAVVDMSGLSTWWKGFVFGLTAYATYDLTNLAVIKNWPVIITFIDILWGSTVTTLTTISVLYIFAR